MKKSSKYDGKRKATFIRNSVKSKQDKLRESYLHISQPNCWETKINKEKILKTGKKIKK